MKVAKLVTLGYLHVAENPSANLKSAYKRVALQVTLKIAMRGHVEKIGLNICLILRMSLRKILYSVH